MSLITLRPQHAVRLLVLRASLAITMLASATFGAAATPGSDQHEKAAEAQTMRAIAESDANGLDRPTGQYGYPAGVAGESGLVPGSDAFEEPKTKPIAVGTTAVRPAIAIPSSLVPGSDAF